MTTFFSGNTLLPADPDSVLPESQDRELDPDTAAWWCIGCPYKGIKSSARGNPESDDVNRVGFGAAGEYSGIVRKTVFVCTSPKQNIFHKYTQEHSTIGFGFCPFLEQKLALFANGNADEEA